jgi:hypothetical protein
MNLSTLKSFQTALLLNWPIGLGLAIWVFSQTGFLKACLFVVAWLVLDKAWDVLTGLLIAGAGAIGANEHEAMLMEVAGEVPARMAAGMLLDLAGTLLLPWLIAGYFLKWYS